MENKNYSVIIDPAAFSQILDCVTFFKKVSFEAAEKLFKDIMDSIYSLENMPLRNPVAPETMVLDEEERRMLIGNGRYYALYCIDGKNIYVEYFGDSRKKY